MDRLLELVHAYKASNIGSTIAEKNTEFSFRQCLELASVMLEAFTVQVARTIGRNKVFWSVHVGIDSLSSFLVSLNSGNSIFTL